jgi:hypothetical protein
MCGSVKEFAFQEVPLASRPDRSGSLTCPRKTRPVGPFAREKLAVTSGAALHEGREIPAEKGRQSTVLTQFSQLFPLSWARL